MVPIEAIPHCGCNTDKYLPTCTKLPSLVFSLVLPLHVPSYDAIHTLTVEAVVISKGGLYETISFMY